MADLLKKVREEQIKLVEKYMQETLPEELPRIKRMNEMLKTGELVPDKNTLEEWAKLYSWA